MQHHLLFLSAVFATTTTNRNAPSATLLSQEVATSRCVLSLFHLQQSNQQGASSKGL